MWVLVLVAVSLSRRPSDKYVLTVYKYWRSNKGNLRTLLGNLVFFILIFCSLGGLNESEMTIPLVGD